jgi:hypothetical protein
LLPKKDAHRYAVDGAPFVCRANNNFDSVQGYLTEEKSFKRNAILHAARVVIVRTTVPTELPWVFLFDVQPLPAAGLANARITLHTLGGVEDIAVEGLAPPSQDEGAEIYLLQGTKQQLKTWARRVTLQTIIAGRTDADRIFQAVGFPKEGWQAHILGAPLAAVQQWTCADRRATVKPQFEADASLAQRYAKCGEYRHAFADHVSFAWLDGFNFRVLTAKPLTHEYKRFLGSPDAIASVFTDLKVRPTPERVGDEPTVEELALAAATVRKDETAVYASLTTTKEAPPGLWEKIAAATSGRLLAATSNVACIAVVGARAGGLIGRTVAGWARLSLAAGR